MMLTYYMCQEKKEAEDLPALKIVWTHQNSDLDYTEKCGRRLNTATRNNTDNMKTNGTTITRKQKWEEKYLYGRFK